MHDLSSTGLSNSLIDIRHATGDVSDTHQRIYAPRAANMSAPKGHEALWGVSPIVLAPCKGRAHDTMQVYAKGVMCGAGNVT